MLVRHILLAVPALTASSAARLHAQAPATTSGTFIVVAGADTISIERFRRTARELTGSIETRVNGRTSRATYSVLRDPTGRPLRLEYSLTIPQRGLSTAALDIIGDSAIGPVMVAERESFSRVAVPHDVIPLLTLNSAQTPMPPVATVSLAMLEDALRAAPRGQSALPMTLLNWGYPALNPVADTVTWINATTVDVTRLGGMRVTLDNSGAILSATGSGTARGAATLVRRISNATSTSTLMPVIVRSAAAPGRAPTPPMGWNSWNKFGCRIDEALIRETADALVSSGMLAAGYRYLNIDDCWEATARDAAGNLGVDSVRFPSGMKSVVDYVHAKGLKVGIYSSGGTGTCQRRPASLDHEVADAQLFASWGIDYLKYDNCNAQNRPEQSRFKAMIDAVKATGREMIFSVCEWGEARPWMWARALGGQLWRTTEDIRDSWMSVLGILDQQVGLDAYAGPDGWNDPDMLEVGNGKMTHGQYIAHFSLWALLNAPLIAGNDIRAMDDSTRAILMNKDVIAVDQDWGGRQGFRLRDDGASEVWAKPMADGGWAVVLLNRGTADATIEVTFAELEAARVDARGGAGASAAQRRVKDLWSGEAIAANGAVRRTVPATGAVMVRIDPPRR